MRNSSTRPAGSPSPASSPAWLDYDPVHNILVEASIFEANFLTDNNAMSEITVINPTTARCSSGSRSPTSSTAPKRA